MPIVLHSNTNKTLVDPVIFKLLVLGKKRATNFKTSISLFNYDRYAVLPNLHINISIDHFEFFSRQIVKVFTTITIEPSSFEFKWIQYLVHLGATISLLCVAKPPICLAHFQHMTCGTCIFQSRKNNNNITYYKQLQSKLPKQSPLPAGHLPLQSIDCDTLAILLFISAAWRSLPATVKDCVHTWPLTAKAMWTDGHYNHLRESRSHCLLPFVHLHGINIIYM